MEETIGRQERDPTLFQPSLFSRKTTPPARHLIFFPFASTFSNSHEVTRLFLASCALIIGRDVYESNTTTTLSLSRPFFLSSFVPRS